MSDKSVTQAQGDVNSRKIRHRSNLSATSDSLSSSEVENPKRNSGGKGERIYHSAKKPMAISSKGDLPSDLAREMGLSQEQAVEVQDEISKFWEIMQKSTAERARYDSLASNQELKRDVYRIPAISDGGDALRAQFEAKLAGIAGKSNAAFILSGLPVQPFGGFGRYDVKLVFEPDQTSIGVIKDKDATKVSYEYINPKNGGRIMDGTSTLEGFSERFGEWSLNKAER